MSTGAKRACCCRRRNPCEPGDPCQVLSATLCVVGEPGECDPAPTVSIIVGPGSTATASITAKVVSQDLRVYGVSGESYSPTDPGTFPDDPGFTAGEDGCAWNHSYTPPPEQWIRGRKVCKTIVEFSGVTLTWQINPYTCTWAMVALGVTVKIGVAADIVETGTPGASGAVNLLIEQDAQEEFLCDIYLALASEMVWCPGDAESSNTYTFTIRRSSGEPFPLPYNADWTACDGIAAGDSIAFPESGATCGTPESFTWPPVDAAVLYSADRTSIQVGAVLLPAGRVGLRSSGTWTSTPTQVHGAVSGDPPFIGVAYASGAWETVTGSVSLAPSNEECDVITDCEECADAQQVNILACVGSTQTRYFEVATSAPACLAGSSCDPETGAWVYSEAESSLDWTRITSTTFLYCSSGAYHLGVKTVKTWGGTAGSGSCTATSPPDAADACDAVLTSTIAATAADWDGDCTSDGTFGATGAGLGIPSGMPTPGDAGTVCTENDPSFPVSSCGDIAALCGNTEASNGQLDSCTVTTASWDPPVEYTRSCQGDACALPSGLSWGATASREQCGPNTLQLCVCPWPDGSTCGLCEPCSSTTTWTVLWTWD